MAGVKLSATLYVDQIGSTVAFYQPAVPHTKANDGVRLVTAQGAVIVPLGTHMLELLKYNPVNVVAAIDYRSNGTLERAGIADITNTVYKVGSERHLPIVSMRANRIYYQRLAAVLSEILAKYPDCYFILSANYTPFTRFIIDQVGVGRIELWEDGLNHYIKMEAIFRHFRRKELMKLFAGFYRGGMFDSDYRGQQIFVRDRFKNKNLHYPKISLTGDKHFYIGQPLIEDSIVSESLYRKKLETFFRNKSVVYLPHPRETPRPWLADVFTVIRPNCSAEQHLSSSGARSVYSAFSTVNVNIDCAENYFIAGYLGLNEIADKLAKSDFGVALI